MEREGEGRGKKRKEERGKKRGVGIEKKGVEGEVVFFFKQKTAYEVLR